VAPIKILSIHPTEESLSLYKGKPVLEVNREHAKGEKVFQQGLVTFKITISWKELKP